MQGQTCGMVKNGKTAVIGGIYQLDDSDSDEGIPILKDIPLIGYLFKRVEVTKNKNELLLFLKPKIVKEISGPMVSKSGPPEANYDPFEEISVDEGRESFENKAEVETDEILESGLEDLPGDDNFSKPTDSEFDEEFAEGDGEEEELTL